MKCTIPEISWHNREPVLSVDIHPISEKFYRLATGGADCHVLIWQLNICDNGGTKLEALSDLTRHQRAVNSIRWSPDGQYLATADDDANIIIWQLKTDNIPLLEGETNDKEIWIINKVMRGHKEDIYDICWSPNSQKLLSGSIDNTAILWDVAKGKSENILTDHKGFVQGVAWDPKSQYIATISTDRVCRIYETSGRQVKCRIQKGYLPVPQDHYLYDKEVKFFHDDTFKSFFRRLDFSPDGSLLAVPSGCVEVEDCEKVFHASYIFVVDSWIGPATVFPSHKQCSTVVRFCPILFELREDGPDAIISLPFRMILAIGTDHDVILYDTQQTAPFAYFKDIHYTRLTDLTWSKDGRLLVASSTDGFCALITFEPNELGVPYVKEESESEDNMMNISGCEEIIDKDDNLDISKEKSDFTKPKKPNLLEQWAIKTPKKDKMCNDSNIKCFDIGNKDDKVISNDVDTNKKELENFTNKDISTKHKRIKPTLVQDKLNDENVYVQKNSVNMKVTDAKKQQKVTPLISFLKSGSKSKQNESNKEISTLKNIDLALDELEARDAFPTENSENKCARDSKNVMDIDEYSEEFSLHLDDTNTAESNYKKQNLGKANEESTQERKEDTEENRDEKCVHNMNICRDSEIEILNSSSTEKAITVVNKHSSVKQMKESESCKKAKSTHNVQMKTDSTDKCKTEDCPEPETLNKAQIENSSENKTVTKRRIPLITLSSPKHKKK